MNYGNMGNQPHNKPLHLTAIPLALHSGR